MSTSDEELFLVDESASADDGQHRPRVWARPLATVVAISLACSLMLVGHQALGGHHAAKAGSNFVELHLTKAEGTPKKCKPGDTFRVKINGFSSTFNAMHPVCWNEAAASVRFEDCDMNAKAFVLQSCDAQGHFFSIHADSSAPNDNHGLLPGRRLGSRTSLCITDELALAQCEGSDLRQLWAVERIPNTMSHGASVSFRNAASGKCMQGPGESVLSMKSVLSMQTCAVGSQDQLFTISPVDLLSNMTIMSIGAIANHVSDGSVKWGDCESLQSEMILEVKEIATKIWEISDSGAKHHIIVLRTSKHTATVQLNAKDNQAVGGAPAVVSCEVVSGDNIKIDSVVQPFTSVIGWHWCDNFMIGNTDSPLNVNLRDSFKGLHISMLEFKEWVKGYVHSNPTYVLSSANCQTFSSWVFAKLAGCHSKTQMGTAWSYWPVLLFGTLMGGVVVSFMTSTHCCICGGGITFVVLFAIFSWYAA